MPFLNNLREQRYASREVHRKLSRDDFELA